ncbi:hypothetical protein [Pedobacter heparinus]|uniref:Bacterial Pleckstrin homology domain-containing protein n=1 Tax=Pedobacter heparinus (strain ATCC 13125 / DSM 2366 / CIP 104194 / JCM 7457 / NBRC 12017 / NCIMB 9290 / NRRL B-14731 / HIM 762-3) TaxID=485917 RepID=C6XVA7_PEDHD|nr:hypothetical protein [Pedobacter heparinus]ACU03973.1 hypothetical protein Phep_1764 [Pedobacter heparinus DSM 2366]
MISKTGNALWLFKDDFKDFSVFDKIGVLFSGIKPLHTHSGIINVTNRTLVLESDADELEIPLKDITQIYLGFDEFYKRSYAKNFGAFWQPLKLTFTSSYSESEMIYLVIDYNFMYSKNEEWFNLLKNLLS